MIDFQNPWTILAGVLLGSPIFLTLLNRWLTRVDRHTQAETVLRHDFVEYIATLEKKLADREADLDLCKDQKYKLQEELLQIKYPHATNRPFSEENIHNPS